MAATVTAYDAALKEIWTQQTLEEQLYNVNPWLEKIEKTSRYQVGQNALVPLHVSRNGGYTPLPTGGGTLNTAGNQGLAQATYNYTHHHQQIAIQGDAIDETSSNTLSVANVIDTEVSGGLGDLRRALTRQLFGNGDALITACVSSGTNGVDLNVTDGYNAIERGWLYIGMPVDVGTSADEESIVNNSLITAVTQSTTAPAITVASGNITTETTSEYVSHANARDGTTSYEMNGLKNLVSTSATFGGLTTASQPTWVAANTDSTSQALTLSLILQQDQKIMQSSGEEADFILTGLKQSRKLYEQLQQQVRFSSDTAISAGAQNTPSWQGHTIYRHPDCQNEYLYVGVMKHLFIVATDKPKWQNSVTGGNILSWIQGTDSYGAKLSYRIQLACNRRNTFAKLSALT